MVLEIEKIESLFRIAQFNRQVLWKNKDGMMVKSTVKG
ncbi:MAG: hypothetical protein ACI8ZN_000933 [Bacteroidia bacterium]|jgi:hypothetical protein